MAGLTTLPERTPQAHGAEEAPITTANVDTKVDRYALMASMYAGRGRLANFVDDPYSDRMTGQIG